MALRQRDNDPVSDKVFNTSYLFLDLVFRRELSVAGIVFINELDYVAVYLFFKTNQRFDPALKSKSQERISVGHVFIEFADRLRLQSQEFVMLKEFYHLYKAIAVSKINAVAAFDRTLF